MAQPRTQLPFFTPHIQRCKTAYIPRCKIEPSALDQHLVRPVDDSTARLILDRLWGIKDCTTSGPYFRYYADRCLAFFHEGGTHITVRTHSDILSIASRIQANEKREDIRRYIDSEAGPPKVDHSIDLVASLLSMTEIGAQEFILWGGQRIYWQEGSLADYLAACFRPDVQSTASRGPLGRSLTGANLFRLSGIEIRWTANLRDHLLLDGDGRKVLIFRCPSFLDIQDKLVEDSIFPPGLIEETIRTFSLLFPSNDDLTTKWISTQHIGDSMVNEFGYLLLQDRRLEKFVFWHDRLEALQQVFDDSRPRTMGQWWRDRRNGPQWYTFWIAILVLVVTVIFGIIQTVEGALQVWISYKASQKDAGTP